MGLCYVDKADRVDGIASGVNSALSSARSIVLYRTLALVLDPSSEWAALRRLGGIEVNVRLTKSLASCTEQLHSPQIEFVSIL